MNLTRQKTLKHLRGLPGKELVNEDELLNKEEKSQCRLGIGRLLLLMRHSRLNTLNIVQDLSRWILDGATKEYQKVLH